MNTNMYRAHGTRAQRIWAYTQLYTHLPTAHHASIFVTIPRSKLAWQALSAALTWLNLKNEDGTLRSFCICGVLCSRHAQCPHMSTHTFGVHTEPRASLESIDVLVWYNTVTHGISWQKGWLQRFMASRVACNTFAAQVSWAQLFLSPMNCARHRIVHANVGYSVPVPSITWMLEQKPRHAGTRASLATSCEYPRTCKHTKGPRYWCEEDVWCSAMSL